jgi:hypothetical protein
MGLTIKLSPRIFAEMQEPMKSYSVNPDFMSDYKTHQQLPIPGKKTEATFLTVIISPKVTT